ncbi:iron-containing redox enzyme family protein [Pendulispora albinea]|uniref:Iron-containing redox enzyme family protein n=1 Tax=Pendulispora albinea TaxID=2741071 RepID=A0ABZ2LS74_9BACT
MTPIEPWYLDLAAPLNAELLAFPIHQRRAYGDFMAQAYYWVSHSTRLLALAASRLGTGNEPQHRRLLEHAREENGHHLYAERDLRHLGMRVEDFSELAPTAALYQTQYYLIEHVHPTALFGYIILLEGVSVLCGREGLERASAAFGEHAVSFLKMHSNADEDHLPKAFATLATLPAELQSLVQTNCKNSAELLRATLRAILARSAQDPS